MNSAPVDSSDSQAQKRQEAVGFLQYGNTPSFFLLNTNILTAPYNLQSRLMSTKRLSTELFLINTATYDTTTGLADFKIARFQYTISGTSTTVGASHSTTGGEN